MFSNVNKFVPEKHTLLNTWSSSATVYIYTVYLYLYLYQPISASISIPISISDLSLPLSIQYIYISLSLSLIYTSRQKWNHSQHPLCLTGRPFQTKSLLLDSSTAILSSLVARSFPKSFIILTIWPYMIPPNIQNHTQKKGPRKTEVSFFCVRKIYRAGCSLSSALQM